MDVDSAQVYVSLSSYLQTHEHTMLASFLDTVTSCVGERMAQSVVLDIHIRLYSYRGCIEIFQIIVHTRHDQEDVPLSTPTGRHSVLTL